MLLQKEVVTKERGVVTRERRHHEREKDVFRDRASIESITGTVQRATLCKHSPKTERNYFIGYHIHSRTLLF